MQRDYRQRGSVLILWDANSYFNYLYIKKIYISPPYTYLIDFQFLHTKKL